MAALLVTSAKTLRPSKSINLVRCVNFDRTELLLRKPENHGVLNLDLERHAANPI